MVSSPLDAILYACHPRLVNGNCLNGGHEAPRGDLRNEGQVAVRLCRVSSPMNIPCASLPLIPVIRMTGAHGKVRPNRTRSLGMECLEERTVLSGVSHAAAMTAHQAAVAAATAQETARLPPTLIESHLQRDGDTVTGLVMVFSKPLNPATAQDVMNYNVHLVGVPVSPSAAVYNPSQESVTLMLARPVKLDARGGFYVTLSSTITDTSGNGLHQGVANFTARGPSPNPDFRTFDQSRINASRLRTIKYEALSKAQSAPQVARDAAEAAAPKIHLTLTGTIQGTYTSNTQYYNTLLGPEYFGIEFQRKGSGSLNPVGQVWDSMTEAPWYTKNPYQSIGTNQASISYTIVLQRVSTYSVEGTYTIVGGSLEYYHASGSGHLAITWTGTASRGKFTEVFS